MNKFRFTRFDTIFQTRESALEKLDATSRYYGENVAIRYLSGDQIKIILSIYKSSDASDYSINFDSGKQIGTTTSGSLSNVIKVTKISTGEEDLSAIIREARETNIDPVVGDVAIVINSGSYIYDGSNWLSLSKVEETIIDCGNLKDI